jgi:DNA-binding FadR family transcriptional regulator
MMEKNNEFLHVALSNDQEWVENVISHHRTIIGAIEEKNSEKAGKGMKKHINESTKRFNQFKNRPEFSKMAM